MMSLMDAGGALNTFAAGVGYAVMGVAIAIALGGPVGRWRRRRVAPKAAADPDARCGVCERRLLDHSAAESARCAAQLARDTQPESAVGKCMHCGAPAHFGVSAACGHRAPIVIDVPARLGHE